MKNLYLTIALVSLSWGLTVTAQLTFQKSWGGTGEDEILSLIPAKDKNYWIMGHSTGVTGSTQDIVISKMDKFGNILWASTYGTSGAENPNSIVETSDSGLMVLGYTSPTVGQPDIYVLRLNKTGGLVWAKSYGSTTGKENGYGISVTTDGGYLITGYSDSISQGQADGYVLKINDSGDTLWTRGFGAGGYEHFSTSLEVSDGYLFGGQAYSWSGNRDMYLLKTDFNGNFQWSKVWDGAVGKYESIRRLMKTPDGNILIGGNTSSQGAGSDDVLLTKIDNAGNTLWSMGYGATGSEQMRDMILSADSNYMIAGVTTSFDATPAGLVDNDAYWCKIDTNGVLLSTRIYAGVPNDWFNAIAATPDSGCIMGGLTKSFIPSTQKADFYIVKTDADGDTDGADSVVTFITTSLSLSSSNVSSGFHYGGTITDMGSSTTVTTFTMTVSTIDPTVGINEEFTKNEFVKISPNPFNTEAYLSISDPYGKSNDSTKKLILYNILGAKMKEISFNKNNVMIYREDLAEGLYTYQLLIDNKVISNGKIIVQ